MNTIEFESMNFMRKDAFSESVMTAIAFIGNRTLNKHPKLNEMILLKEQIESTKAEDINELYEANINKVTKIIDELKTMPVLI
ncbi:hypothetical protein DC083_01175 [Ignatzschineria ureiclastica]|uniref:Uncharacterized protein n=1 Tax=Ignatzschineria ureiclastica TaxID=472582 RepID=A0A2U2AGQ5_9GAMM|nr:hypothetical protein [Ignatzschineria ureiclastica]PWD81835.1 hypothetical protein DC083_01175 [Ignatzschineria ureiclastica]GGZ90812.1 hypothetical protein GCM10007162_02260 [Ignatzschineria ureiclastica]